MTPSGNAGAPSAPRPEAAYGRLLRPAAAAVTLLFLLVLVIAWSAVLQAGDIGVNARRSGGAPTAATIVQVQPGSPAERAGLGIGATVLTVNGAPAGEQLVASNETAVYALRAGELAVLRVQRASAEAAGSVEEVRVALQPRLARPEI